MSNLPAGAGSQFLGAEVPGRPLIKRDVRFLGIIDLIARDLKATEHSVLEHQVRLVLFDDGAEQNVSAGQANLVCMADRNR